MSWGVLLRDCAREVVCLGRFDGFGEWVASPGLAPLLALSQLPAL